MTINKHLAPVNCEAGPTGMRGEKDLPTPSTSCSTETLRSFLSGDNSHSAAETNNASFADLDGLLDEDLLDDDDDDDTSEDELSEKEEEKETTKKKRKVGRIVKVRASDLCRADGGNIDPKQFERVVKHWRSQKGGKGGIEKVPRIVMRSSSKADASPAGPMRRSNSNLRSMMRRQRGESSKQVRKERSKDQETRRRKPPRKISSISLDSFKSVLRTGKKKSKKSSKVTAIDDESKQDNLNKGQAPFPRLLQRIPSSGKSSRWGSGSEHSESPQKKQVAAPPSRPARTAGSTMSPVRSKSFPVRPDKMMNQPPLVSGGGSDTQKPTLFEREEVIRDAGITPAMIEKLRRVGLYISDTP